MARGGVPFERVACEILTPLHTSGRFDVTMLGILYKGQPGIKYEYPVYTAGTDSDILGVYGFQKAVKKHRPDVVWVLQDLWNILQYVTLKDLDLPMAAYYPVDAPNMKWGYAIATGGLNAVATYAAFGAQETAAGIRDFTDMLVESAEGRDILAEQRTWVSMPNLVTSGAKLHCRLDRLARYQNVESYAVVPHGHDHAAFGVRDKRAAREAFGIPEDAFVVLNINTNQFRKRQDLTLRAFGMLLERVPKARLVMHCVGHTDTGWDLEQLVTLYGLKGHVHMIHETKEQLTEDELVELYNTGGVQISRWKFTGMRVDGMDAKEKWSEELLDLSAAFRRVITERPEEAALTEAQQERATGIFTRWLQYTPEQEPLYTLRYAEEQGKPAHSPDWDQQELLNLCLTAEDIATVQDIDDVRDKIRRYVEVLEIRRELMELQTKQARMYAESVESRREITEEFARVYFCTEILDEKGMPQGPLAKTLEGVPAAQALVFNYDWLSHGCPTPEEFEEAVRRHPSRGSSKPGG